ncbi:peptidoglycan-associated lipoprotein Pal [candidate division KSB1 bacterium]|nr:peptidoglycan-associated lipoprotein Pal [candidate division KSB1 bacterium]
MKLLKITLAMIAMLALIAIIGCSKKVTKTAPATEETATPISIPSEESGKSLETIDLGPREKSMSKSDISFRDINFDFDKYELSSEAREILANHARLLKENPQVRLKIEGHCDERGTIEYNLALGERRANVVKNYLVNYGVDSYRLSTISYGKERPLDLRSTPDAWAMNRRATFVVLQ